MSDPTTEFAALAERYCAWASGLPSDCAADEQRARELLPVLFLAAHALPEGAPGEAEPSSITQAQWEVIHKRFRHLSIGYYGEAFDPLIVPPEEPVIADLADDLADIYRDLLGPLDLFRAGEVLSAAWHWRYNFIIHWGAHLVGALRALHHSWAKANPPY